MFRALGADTILLAPAALTLELRYDLAYQNLQEELRRALPAAEKARVNLAVENVWSKFLLSPLEARQFVDELGSACVGIYFDIGNYVPWAYPEHWIGILGSRIKKAHAKDFHRGQHAFVPMPTGDVACPAVMKALRTTGYNGDLIQEVAGDKVGMRAARQALQRIVKM